MTVVDLIVAGSATEPLAAMPARICRHASSEIFSVSAPIGATRNANVMASAVPAATLTAGYLRRAWAAIGPLSLIHI